MALVTFKSSKPFFDKEKADIKNSTIRIIDPTDTRFKLLEQYALGNLRKLVIEIVCPQTQEKFRRHVRDVCYLPFISKGVDLLCITWDEKREE